MYPGVKYCSQDQMLTVLWMDIRLTDVFIFMICERVNATGLFKLD